MFLTFSSEEERRKFGGSYFIELQYCRLQPGMERKEMVSVDVIGNWKNDSLYIYGDDDSQFIFYYGKIFVGGIYNNGKSGMVDIYGINYYSWEQTELIIGRVRKMKPLDYPMLLNWLEKSEKYNGFYILGL